MATSIASFSSSLSTLSRLKGYKLVVDYLVIILRLFSAFSLTGLYSDVKYSLLIASTPP
jgi:hypothetical protein